jgi:energy-coupling factor transport system ATP-binding protein
LSPPPAPLVRLRGVRWTADRGLPDEREILTGIDLEIRPRQRVGLVGRSGAGKTTLATILAGLAEPTAGEVTRGQAYDVGLVFQEPERGFFEETVLVDVAFGAKNAGLSEEEALAKAGAALRTVGLDPERIGPRAPETLSGGEARRAAIAGVLAFGPRLLVFDEPTTGLDADGLARFRAILAELRAGGCAYFVVSHDLPLLIEECEHILVLDEGRIAWEGEPVRLSEGLPRSWRDDPVIWGGELVFVAEALRRKGVIDETVPPTAAALAAAWTGGR